MPAGRPTKYNKKVLAQAEYYLEHYDEKGIDNFIPSIAGLAVYLEVTKRTLYMWMEKHSTFDNLCDRILAKQESVLLDKGLRNDCNANIAKLALHNHGYKEKTEVKQKSKTNINVTKDDANSF
jgi:molybdopterin-guanine dinucleotide biosynthesis protein